MFNFYKYRLAIVASGAASGKLLEYEVGGPRVSVQTAYGMEVEVRRAHVTLVWSFLSVYAALFSISGISWILVIESYPIKWFGIAPFP